MTSKNHSEPELLLPDGRGLAPTAGRDGRLITESEIDKLKSALVWDKVGVAISRIELLVFCAGTVPVNISSFLPVAASEEAGIEAENHAMSTIIEYQNLIKFWEL